MKKKRRRVKIEDSWRVIKMRLPLELIKGLSAVRDENGNVLPLPQARGNAILNMLNKALEVNEQIAEKLLLRENQLQTAAKILKKYEDRFTEKGVEYADILEKEKVQHASGAHAADGDDQDNASDTCKD